MVFLLQDRPPFHPCHQHHHNIYITWIINNISINLTSLPFHSSTVDDDMIETPRQPFLLLQFNQCPAGRVFQYRVGSGRVLDKIPGSGSGSGRVGVSKNTIGYFRVSFCSFGYFWVFWGMWGIFGYFWVYPYILWLFSNIQWGLKRLQQNQTGFR